MTTLKYHFVAFLIVSIWGSTFVFTKMLLLAGLSPAQIFTLRFIIAYVLLLGYSLLRGKKGRKNKRFHWFSESWRDELLMVALGIAGGSLYFLTEQSLAIGCSSPYLDILSVPAPQPCAGYGHADGCRWCSHCCAQWTFCASPLTVG